MLNRTTLTKSLHTVSAVTRLALYLRAQGNTSGAAGLVKAALTILGHDVTDFDRTTDDTILRCVASVKKAVG